MTFALLLAMHAEEAEHHVGLFDNIGYGFIALGAFGLLALVTVSYRNVANRHSHKAEAYARAHADDVQHTGHGH